MFKYSIFIESIIKRRYTSCLIFMKKLTRSAQKLVTTSSFLTFRSNSLKKFRESCPERWEEVVKMQKKFSSRYRSLTCVTFFSKEKGKASGETIHQEDFDFTGKEISISNNTASSFDYDLDLIYNNIFVVVTL